MRYGSDLDLVFLYRRRRARARPAWTTGSGSRARRSGSSRAMEAMLEEGRLYKVDTRLRPSGEQGLLVTSWSAFERYHQRRGRGLGAGGAAARARRLQQRGAARCAREREALLRRDRVRPPVRPAALRRRSAPRARARSRASAGACRRGRATCASIPGGIMDVEFLVALGQLRQRRRRRRAPRRRPPRWRAWWRWAGPSRCSTTTRRCAARRCACACCSIAPKTSCPPATCRCSPAASARPPKPSPPTSTPASPASARIFDERFA